MSLFSRFLRFSVTRIVIWILLTGLVALVVNLLHLPGETNWWLGVGAALALWFVGRVIEGRRPPEFGFGTRGMVRDTLAGFGLAALMMSAIIGVMALLGWYRVTGVGVSGRWLLWVLVHFFFVALLEETAMRGVIFRIVEESLGSWVSLALSALIFGLLHLGNANASLMAALAIAMEAGLLLAAAFMLTRNLWLAIGIHWGWNFVQGPVFGAPVSGGRSVGLLHGVFSGPALATGGAFGPEAGLIALLVGTLVGGWLLWLAIRRGRVIAPFWRRRAAPAGQEALRG